MIGPGPQSPATARQRRQVPRRQPGRGPLPGGAVRGGPVSGDRVIRFATAAVVCAVAAFAAVVSYSHIYGPGRAHGQDGTAARLLRSSRVGPHGRKVADGRSHAAREQPDHAQARRARPVWPAGSERAFQRPPELLGDARTPLRRGRVRLRRRDATRTFRVRAISRWSQPRYRSHARAAGGRASETSSAARRMCRTYSCPMAA